jgi:hypothetical protein
MLSRRSSKTPVGFRRARTPHGLPEQVRHDEIQKHSRDASFASELYEPRRVQKRLPPCMIPKSGVRFSDKIMHRKEGRRSADRRTVHVRALQISVRELAQLICGAAAARIASRSPFGAPPRHSPGRTHPPLAQLQFPRFLRPDLTGVTRFDLSRVYRAPRRPVVMPAER